MTLAPKHSRSTANGGGPGQAARRLITVFALAFGYWSAIELWGQVLNGLNGMRPQSGMLPGQLLGVAGAGTISLISYEMLRLTSATSLPRRLAAGAVAALVCSSVYALLMIALAQVMPVSRPQGAVGLAHFAWDALFFLPPFALAMVVMLVLESSRLDRERDSRLSAALVHAREAEVRALHYQVNPHFLYNALNSLSTLILEGRSAEADQMVHRLAAFFRSNLTVDPLADVALSEELEQQRRYLALEQIRYRGRLEVEFDVPDDLLPAQTPSLILQPLVENAIKHGIHEPGRRTTISIRARQADGCLQLDVRDDGPAGGETLLAGAGVGLTNVRQRLRARFGDVASLEAASDAGGFTARIVMPLVYATAQQNAATLGPRRSVV